MKMFDVITFGSATLDVFLRSSGLEVNGTGAKKKINVNYGAKLDVSELDFCVGGGGVNTATTFARQGLKTVSVVQIGQDFAGDKVYTELVKEGINTSFVCRQKDCQTDYATILWADDGGRTVLIYRGNTRLEITDINFGGLQAKWFYVTSLEGNLEIVEKLAGSGGGAKIAWNPGGRELVQRQRLLAVLPGIEVLVLNREEMGELLLGNNAVPIKELLTEAEKLLCKILIITDGVNGAYLFNKAEATWWHCGIFKDSPVIETTGAGDAFGSGFLASFFRGYDIHESLFRAMANSASVIAQVGSRTGILTVDEVNSFSRNKLDIGRM